VLRLLVSVLCLHLGRLHHRDAKAPLHNTGLRLPDVKSRRREALRSGARRFALLLWSITEKDAEDLPSGPERKLSF
jgi:hypothetical protein